MLKILLFCALLSLSFSEVQVSAQDISRNTENGSGSNGSEMTQEELLKSLSNNVILDLQDIEKCLNITKDSENTINNSNQTLNNSLQTIADSNQTINSSDNALNLSIEDEQKIKEFLTNTLTEIPEPQKTKRPHRELYLIGGVFLGIIIGIACF